MINQPDPLAQLRDIHLPEPLGWWPPAPGWWLAALIVLAALAAGARYLWLYFAANRYRRLAGQELRLLREDRSRYSSRLRLEKTAALLRRVAILTCGRQKAASLVGEAWLEFLDKSGGTDQFTKGPGRILAEGYYRTGAAADLEKLWPVVDQWIRRHRPC